VDWGYNSGRKTVAKMVQRILTIECDGIIGEQSLKAINSTAQQKFFDTLKIERKVFLNNIIKRKPDQIVFYDGWMNRVNSFKFKA
jgi:lysozyme family protein